MYYLFAVPLVFLAMHPVAGIGALLVTFAVVIVWAGVSDKRRRDRAEAAERERLAADADEQNQSALRGEPYGVYGRPWLRSLVCLQNIGHEEQAADDRQAAQNAAQPTALTVGVV